MIATIPFVLSLLMFYAAHRVHQVETRHPDRPFEVHFAMRLGARLASYARSLLPPDYWVTANGRQMRICEMHSEHLLNTIALLQRRGEHNEQLQMLLQEGIQRGLRFQIQQRASWDSLAPMRRAQRGWS